MSEVKVPIRWKVESVESWPDAASWVVVPVAAPSAASSWASWVVRRLGLSAQQAGAFEAAARRRGVRGKPGDQASWDLSARTHLGVALLGASAPEAGSAPSVSAPSPFEWHEAMRKLITRLPWDGGPGGMDEIDITLDLRCVSEDQSPVALEAWVQALMLWALPMPTQKSSAAPGGLRAVHLSVIGWSAGAGPGLTASVDRAVLRAWGTHEVRHLAQRASNNLTVEVFAQHARAYARQEGLGFEFVGLRDLRRLGAGAFLAVCQGSSSPAGIAVLTYRPRGSARGVAAAKKVSSLALVGKGVVFDTGGINLKGGKGLYGMHQDMAGAAVALSLVGLARREQWPMPVTAYLALANNLIGPDAYRPGDIVRTLAGPTIEVIDTDAEGRMLLADTLALAAREKPAWIIDFATLTGACIRALGTIQSGVFTNRPGCHGDLVAAGQRSGERVWPLPILPDQDRALESEVADVKQCRLDPGPDHLDAAAFLGRFVGDVPWVHVDLAAAEHEGGLGAVGTRTTGFGLRLGAELCQTLMGRQLTSPEKHRLEDKSQRHLQGDGRKRQPRTNILPRARARQGGPGRTARARS